MRSQGTYCKPHAVPVCMSPLYEVCMANALYRHLANFFKKNTGENQGAWVKTDSALLLLRELSICAPRLFL